MEMLLPQSKESQMQILKRKFLLNYQERYCNILAGYLVVWLRLYCCLFLLISILIPTFFYATRATLLQDLVLFLVFMLSHGTHTQTHTHTRTGWTLHLQLRCRWLRRVLLTFNYSIFRGFVRLYFVVGAVVVAELLLWGLKIPFIVCTLQTVVHVITNSPPAPQLPPFWMSISWV